MDLILELKKLKNKIIKIEKKLKKQELKKGDEVNFLYYKTFSGYKVKKSKIVNTNVDIYDEFYNYELKLENGETQLADNIEVQLMKINK